MSEPIPQTEVFIQPLTPGHGVSAEAKINHELRKRREDGWIFQGIEFQPDLHMAVVMFTKPERAQEEQAPPPRPARRYSCKGNDDEGCDFASDYHYISVLHAYNHRHNIWDANNQRFMSAIKRHHSKDEPYMMEVRFEQ